MISNDVILYILTASDAFVNNLFGNFPATQSKDMFYGPSVFICNLFI